ncbi:MAG: hypothetical protein WC464_01275 [Bdellovibrionales bacterium]
MRNSRGFLSLLFFCATFAPFEVCAQGYAPELYNVGEVIVNYVRLDDPKAASICGLSREEIASVFASSFEGTGVPAVAALDAKPPMVGKARIQLIPQIATYADENMNCVSWISITAESRANLAIPPVNVPRGVTILYWRQHAKVFSSQTIHSQKVKDVLKKMALEFAQRYRLDQPPEPAQQ